jgi:hypothetical protein
MKSKLLFSVLFICLFYRCVFPQVTEKELDRKSIQFIQPFKNQEFENGNFYVYLKGDSIKSYNNFILYYSTNNGYSWDILKKIAKSEISILYDSLKIKINNDSIFSELSKLKIECNKMKNSDTLFFLESETFNIKSNNGSNFAIISAIKSISGAKPTYEFIDLNLYLNVARYLNILMSADVAIKSSSDTNNARYKLSEAGLFLDFGQVFKSKNKYYLEDRQIILGPLVKIFNTIPYYGFYIGNAEIRGKLVSSYINVCFMQRLIGVENNGDSLNSSLGFHNNLYFEFAIHSEHIEFLKYLRIKGGLLVPLWGWQSSAPKAKDIESRVVIEVPIGKVFRF